MPADALVLALLAAFVHAGWNVLVADAEDPQAVAALGLAVGMLLLAPFAVLTWDVGARAVPYLAASAVAHLGYFLLLTRGYARADLGLVYPIARGSAPVLVLLGAALVVGERPSAGEVAGVLLVVAGILLVRGLPGGARAPRADVALALLTGALIATYTVLDDRGVEHAAPIPYLVLLLAPMTVALVAVHGRRHGRARLRAMLDRRVAVAGAGMVAAYVLALLALERAAAAPVAAVRETSVLMAVGLAAAAATERVSPVRGLGAALAVAGIAALALA